MAAALPSISDVYNGPTIDKIAKNYYYLLAELFLKVDP